MNGMVKLSELRPGETFQAALTGRIGIVLKQRRRIVLKQRTVPATIAYFEDGKPKMLCALVMVYRLDLPRWPTEAFSGQRPHGNQWSAP